MECALRGDAQVGERALEDPRMRLLRPDDGGDREAVEEVGELEAIEQQRQALIPVRNHRQLEAREAEAGEHLARAGRDHPGLRLREAVEELGGREGGRARRVHELAGALDEVTPEAARTVGVIHEAVVRRRGRAGELLPDERDGGLDVGGRDFDAVPAEDLGVLLPERRTGEQRVGDVEGHRFELHEALDPGSALSGR